MVSRIFFLVGQMDLVSLLLVTARKNLKRLPRLPVRKGRARDSSSTTTMMVCSIACCSPIKGCAYSEMLGMAGWMQANPLSLVICGSVLQPLGVCLPQATATTMETQISCCCRLPEACG